MTIQTDQNLMLQKLYILATGSAANSKEMVAFNGIVGTGGINNLNSLVDSYIGAQITAHGMAATVKAIAVNGFGLTLSDAQTKQLIDNFTAAGITTGSQMLNYASKLQDINGTVLNNRAHAASDFLDTLSAAGKSDDFVGFGVTNAVHSLLQNIGSSTVSASNGTSGFNALSANLSATGIAATLDDYLTGSTIFADSNHDGAFNQGEWNSVTLTNGAYVVPGSITAEKVVVYGGVDLLTGNGYKGVLSSSTGATVINPFTTMIESMVITGQVRTVLDASTAMDSTLGLPVNINLLSYNALGVLASTTASAADKAVALGVETTAQQLSNIITQISSVIDNATAGATLQSAAAAVSIAMSQAIANGTLHLTNVTDIVNVIQTAFTATGTVATPAQVAQIAQVTVASNLAAASATNITLLSQAAEVAQGSATNALIAGALSGNYGAAVTGFTGPALDTADYSAIPGNIAPGVPAPQSVGQIAEAAAAAAAVIAAAAAAAAAAATALLAAPTASLSYSTNGGATTASTIAVQDANTLHVIATFSKAVTDGTPTITINNGILAVTAMTKIDSTHYSYDLNVPAGDVPVATIQIGGAHDATSNTISATPTNAVFAVDNTAPSAPTGLVLAAVGGTVVANTLNATNTNMTAVATITAGDATGGSAVLKIGTVAIATDASILAGDTSVTFNLGVATTAALQAAVAAGGVATVTVIDAAGNAAVSTLSNPTLVVDYSPPSFALTTANDTISGSGVGDVFTGNYGNGAGPYTFNTGDVLDGLAGIDTLKITTGAEASSPPDGLWLNKTNFEKIVLDSIGNGAQVLTSGPAFQAAFATNGINLSVQTLLGAIDVTLTTFTGAATISTHTIGAGAHTITTGSGVSTVTALGDSAGAQTINGVGLTTVDATINGGGNQVIGTTNGGNLVSVHATITAAGSQTIASTSSSDVTIVASAFSGSQTVTTAGGNDHVTTSGAVGQSATIDTGAGNDVIVSGLTTDLITGGTGADTMTGGGGVDTFQFNANGSIIGTSMDIITDFNVAGADVLAFGSGTAVLLTADATALIAGANVDTSAGGLITFHAADNTLALKIAAVEADSQLDAAGSVAMFVHAGNTYVYYAGAAVGNADDQLIELAGVTTLTTIIGGATMVIS